MNKCILILLTLIVSACGPTEADCRYAKRLLAHADAVANRCEESPSCRMSFGAMRVLVDRESYVKERCAKTR